MADNDLAGCDRLDPHATGMGTLAPASTSATVGVIGITIDHGDWLDELAANPGPFDE